MVLSRVDGGDHSVSYVMRTHAHTKTRRTENAKNAANSDEWQKKKKKNAKRREENETDFDDGARAMRSGAIDRYLPIAINNLS